MISSKKYFYRKVLYIFYDAPALSRLQRTHESSTNILRYCSVGYSVHHVRKKKTCLTGWLRAVHFVFPNFLKMRMK